ncbi:MAG: DUF1565 domain-containing protein [Acidobacteriaceae bacterium]
MTCAWKYLALCISLPLLAAGFVPPAHAASFYVSASGVDSNPGTQAQPFKTLQHAAAEAKPGDTVIVLGVVY